MVLEVATARRTFVWREVLPGKVDQKSSTPRISNSQWIVLVIGGRDDITPQKARTIPGI